MQRSQSPQARQLSSYSRTISSLPASVAGQSGHAGGGRSSKNSAISKSTRFVRHDHAPSGSFFEACVARKRAKPIEITCAANRAPGKECTDITPTPELFLPPGLQANHVRTLTYSHKTAVVNAPETERQASLLRPRLTP